ncbi:hypothetical protein C8J28_12411 [Cereibacter azotoformans]|uniref:Uncharacterized protein n=1 Tax=Cereibacter azotoformans TaxID=43057 RepID=A0A2T5JSV8_9RHOB|nr:hypothetical protein C8J28_12411 [Cereibacter azotoformans]
MMTDIRAKSAEFLLMLVVPLLALVLALAHA